MLARYLPLYLILVHYYALSIAFYCWEIERVLAVLYMYVWMHFFVKTQLQLRGCYLVSLSMPIT